MDLSGLSDDDFAKLQSGNLKGMSDAGFARLLEAQQAALTKPQKIAQAQRISSEKNSPLNDMSPAKRFAAGMGQQVTDIGLALRQALPGSSATRGQVDEKRREDAPLLADPYGRAGSIIGSAAVGSGAMLLPGAGSVVGAAAYGAGLGAASPIGAGEGVGTVARNAMIGSAGGAGSAMVGNAIGGLLAPKVKPGQSALMAAGIPLTSGQRMGGAMKRAEDALTSVPVIGDVVRNAQTRSFEGFNAAVANRALAPINAKLPPGTVGREAVAYTERALGDAYEGVLRRIGNVKADAAFAGEIQNLRQMVRTSPLPDEVKAQFDSVVNSQISGKFQGQNSMTAQTFKDAESELGRYAAKYAKDASADKQLLGDAIQEAQAALRRLLERTNPALAADAKAANKGWAEFRRMQRASSMLGAREGVFSPENYLNAVKTMAPTVGTFARGNALGQELADSAVSVMGRTVPDSGTPFRTLWTDPIRGTIAVAAGSPVAALYSRPVQSALQMLATGKRPALATKAAAELEMARPALNALGISYANESARSGAR